MTVKSARKARGKATGRKVKSKEIVDDAASDDSKEKDDSVVGGGTENSVDGKRKRQSHKTKPGAADKDGKVSRKRPTKNKVCQDVVCITSMKFSYRSVCWKKMNCIRART